MRPKWSNMNISLKDQWDKRVTPFRSCYKLNFFTKICCTVCCAYITYLESVLLIVNIWKVGKIDSMVILKTNIAWSIKKFAWFTLMSWCVFNYPYSQRLKSSFLLIFYIMVNGSLLTWWSWSIVYINFYRSYYSLYILYI